MKHTLPHFKHVKGFLLGIQEQFGEEKAIGWALNPTRFMKLHEVSSFLVPVLMASLQFPNGTSPYSPEPVCMLTPSCNHLSF